MKDIRYWTTEQIAVAFLSWGMVMALACIFSFGILEASDNLRRWWHRD